MNNRIRRIEPTGLAADLTARFCMQHTVAIAVRAMLLAM